MSNRRVYKSTSADVNPCEQSIEYQFVRLNNAMSGVKFSSSLLKKIWDYSELPQTAVSLRQMCQFGSHPSPGIMFKASFFILQELPIRLAHRIKDLESLPNGLNKMSDVIEVRNWYIQSFKELHEFSHDLSTKNGRLYQIMAGSADAGGFAEKNSVSRITKMLYGTKHTSQRVTDWHFNDEKTFIDDGLIVPHMHSPKKSNSVHKRTLAEKYHSALPPETMEQWSESQDFYGFWPKEILMFNNDFYRVLQNIKIRHDATVVTLAKGVLKWRTTSHQNVVNDSVQSFLDRFYLSRIGIRMLIGQHLALLKASLIQDNAHLQQKSNQDDENYVGIICTNTNITHVAQDAIDSARFICSEHYGLYEAPEVNLLCFPLSKNSDIEFMYVPGHLIHMLVETLKNALRATVEKIISANPNKSLYDLKFPEVKVIISEGLEDITVKISDEGGGIARSSLPLVWTYLYTTMPDDSQKELIDGTSAAPSSFRVPMAGYGYGLALSRLYARYFGGDLKLISMEGFGTDVYLHLNRLNISSEPLP